MIEYLVPILLALIAAAPGVWAILSQRNKIKVDAATEINNAAIALIKPYRERIAELEKRVNALEVELDAQRSTIDFYEEIHRGARRLHSQVKSLGGDPVYNPPERRQ